MTPKLFRKKPVQITAMRLLGSEDGGAAREVAHWCGGHLVGSYLEPRIFIQTLEGQMRADNGDWIIRGVQGEFYPCKPDIFAQTYEPVPDGAAMDAKAADRAPCSDPTCPACAPKEA